jgi:hypothetical protein
MHLPLTFRTIENGLAIHLSADPHRRGPGKRGPSLAYAASVTRGPSPRPDRDTVQSVSHRERLNRACPEPVEGTW